MKKVSRRTFVLGGLAVAGATATTAAAAAPSVLATIPYPFKLGVASGEPLPDGVVLWTRLAPSPLNADGQGGMPNSNIVVEWQVSTNDRFTVISASGSVTATSIAAQNVPGKFDLRMAVGELGIPMSPNTLVLPPTTNALPTALRQAGMVGLHLFPGFRIEVLQPFGRKAGPPGNEGLVYSQCGHHRRSGRHVARLEPALGP